LSGWLQRQKLTGEGSHPGNNDQDAGDPIAELPATHSHAVFDPRSTPNSPTTVTTAPPSKSHIDLSVAEPVKSREMSELVESYAVMPKINRRMPPARTANEIALFIEIPSL
jgi:hypothetical protein